MSTHLTSDEPPIQARIPADLEAPDRLVAGLTARQLALLASAAVPLYLLWQNLNRQVPLPFLAAIVALIAAGAVTVALGHRDGLSLDRWLAAAAGHTWRVHRLTPTGRSVPAPAWVPAATGREPHLTPLRLPAGAIGEDGVISTGSGAATVLVAASTVTAGLHTTSEQAALMGGFARWLNSLTGAVQMVVSTRRVDLGPRALRLAENAHRLPHPALARAAIDHAEYLLDLSEDGERLTRTLTIACTAHSPARNPRSSRPGGSPAAGAGAEALRRAERTAAALSLLGSRCRILTGADVIARLVTATDPYGPTDASWPRALPSQAVTSEPAVATTRRPVPRPDNSSPATASTGDDEGGWSW
jgi:hypothetical protein